MPDMMVLDGMPICCNYNVLDYGDASYWLIFFRQRTPFGWRSSILRPQPPKNGR
jgi:hypothetical protein